MIVQPPAPPPTPPPTLHVGAGALEFLPGAMESVDHAPLTKQDPMDTNARVQRPSSPPPSSPPPSSPPPSVRVGAGTPEFLRGAMKSTDRAPLQRHNSVDTNAMVKALCQHTMKASEMSRLVEAEIRQLSAENAALHKELSAHADQAQPKSTPLWAAPFDRHESGHSSSEVAPFKSGRCTLEGDQPRLAHVEGGPSGRFSAQSNGLHEESEIPKDALQQQRSNSRQSEVAADAKTSTDQVNSKITLKTAKTLSRIQHKAQKTLVRESQMAGEIMSQRKTQIKRHLLFDPERIKNRLREAIVKPVYDVKKFYHKEGYAQAMARSGLFENTTLVVILFNAIWIAVDTQHNRAEVLLDADPVFQVAEQIFCSYFFVEWLVRFMAFKRKRDCKNDAWFVFDTVLMVTMVTETWIMTIILLILRGDGGSSTLGFLKNASLVRMLRLLRITRLARAVKLLRFAPEVMVMLKAVLSSMRCVLWTFVLLVCIVFFFGVGFTQLCRGSTLEEAYFTSLTMSMHNLLIAGVFPDLHDMSIDISNEHILYWFLWMLFMLFAGLAILNLLVGVLVEIVKNSSNVERDSMDVAYTRQTFMKCLGLEEFQQDAAHIDMLTISKEQFADLMDDDVFILVLLSVGIDIIGLVDLVDWMFFSGDMKFTELLEIILQLRSSATVTVRDIVDLRKFLTFEIHKMQADLYFMAQRIRSDDSKSQMPEHARSMSVK